ERRAPRPARDPGSRRGRRLVRGLERVLPGLDRRQLRPLPRPARRARLPDSRLRRHRVRHRAAARAARPPAPLADRSDHHVDGHPVRDPVRGGVLPAAADHRPREPDRDRRARVLHAAHHLPQHHRRPAQRAGGDRRRGPRPGADRPADPAAGRAPARRPRDPRRPADRLLDHRRPRDPRGVRGWRRARLGDPHGSLLQVQRRGGGRPGRPPGRRVRPHPPRRAARGDRLAEGGTGM
ncbi:MAG: Glycine betaine ABC transport system permease protein, partial [uncultured Solirubrobacteraceae bacterium]